MKKETFDTLWNNGIKPKSKEIVNNNVGIVTFDTASYERIFCEYNKLKDFAKISYMRDPDGLLDRHKVCACLIIAIIKSKPLVYDENEDVFGMKKIFNENLAITIGLSLLYNFISDADEGKNKEWLKDGFEFPVSKRDSTYQELLCLMLHYDVMNNQYSILAVSNILYLIEEYTKLSRTLKHE